MGSTDEVGTGTRMVVKVDGRWDPTAVFMRIQSAGLPIQGVKSVDYGCYTLSFAAPLTPEAVTMLQSDIVSFFARGAPSERRVSKDIKKTPGAPPSGNNTRDMKNRYVNRRR